ncbi:MAG: ABC transporter ATP-binding protein [Flavobacteriia bacterium]|nr:ABC transporter ATP-binding protein [Flavobacteriia bacterium]
MPLIEVSHLQKNFGAFQAVKDVSFSVHEGDVFGFLGPNGAGKSTTIRCLLSLIKPSGGTIQFFGSSLSAHRNDVLKRVGCIIEKPDFYKYLSAQRNLEIFARISGSRISTKQILEMIDFVGLSGREKHKVSGFSHGMKQRLGIAQTLLHNPDVIILDEPTTGLDPQGIIEVRNLILRLRDEQKKTVLLSSHQLSEIEIIANRMVIINQGKTIVEGEVKALLEKQSLNLEILVDNEQLFETTMHSFFRELPVKKLYHNTYFVELKEDNRVLLIRKLVEEGCGVKSVISKRSLEDFFIKMTEK